MAHGRRVFRPVVTLPPSQQFAIAAGAPVLLLFFYQRRLAHSDGSHGRAPEWRIEAWRGGFTTFKELPMDRTFNKLRSARLLAAKKGFVLRKLRGDDGYTLSFAAGPLANFCPMMFESLDEVLSEIRMR